MTNKKHSNVKSKDSELGLKSFEAYPKIIEHITIGSKLTVKDINQLEELFGDRLKKALELVASNKVKKYLFQPSGIIRWLVIGHKADYLIIEHSFCSCSDFLFRSLLKRDTPSCYHLLAREIAERTEKFELITIDDELYTTQMDSWL